MAKREIYFDRAAYLAGGVYPERIRASAGLAIMNGDNWQDVLNSLIRNRPEWFDHAEGVRRMKKESRK